MAAKATITAPPNGEQATAKVNYKLKGGALANDVIVLQGNRPKYCRVIS